MAWNESFLRNDQPINMQTHSVQMQILTDIWQLIMTLYELHFNGPLGENINTSLYYSTSV